MLAVHDRLIGKLSEVYASYGFERLTTPSIEFADALGKFLPDQDRPHEGVFSFQDDDGQWLVLRYDLTAPLARYVAENFDTLAFPYRRFQTGLVFRDEKPGPGRFREFIQFDADTVGTASMAADAEFCMLVADSLEALGLARGDYIVKVNNRKVLNGMLELIGVSEGPEGDATRLTVLRAMDKLDRLGIKGVAQLLGGGRKDESGDFTKGAGLPADRHRPRAWLSPCRGRHARGGLHLDDGKGERQRGRRTRRRGASGNRCGIDGGRVWPRSRAVRSGDHPRAGLLHRPGFRSGAQFRNQGRRGTNSPVRLGRRRRTL